MPRNPIELLGLQDNASKTDIKKAYLQKIREFPPDKFPEQFKQIRQAYETLQAKTISKSSGLDNVDQLTNDVYFTAEELTDMENALFPKLTIHDMIKLTF